MLEYHEAILRAATAGAIIGAAVGALAGLVAFGDRLFVPLLALVAGAFAGAALLASLAARRAPGRGAAAPVTAEEPAG